jgi:hypothetical protein
MQNIIYCRILAIPIGNFFNDGYLVFNYFSTHYPSLKRLVLSIKPIEFLNVRNFRIKRTEVA